MPNLSSDYRTLGSVPDRADAPTVPALPVDLNLARPHLLARVRSDPPSPNLIPSRIAPVGLLMELVCFDIPNEIRSPIKRLGRLNG